MIEPTTLCEDVQVHLSAYLDSRLPQDELALVRGHLGDCQACRSERQALEKTDALVQAALGDHPFGDDFVEGLLGELVAHEMPRRAQPAPRSLRPAGLGVAALAAGLLLALGIGLNQDDGGEKLPIASAPNPVVAEAGPGLLIVTRDGSSVALEPGSQIRAGDRLLAVASPPAHVSLPDGTRVDLHADTEVSLKRERGGLTVVVGGAEGKVFCQVAKRREPFRVKARGLDVLVLGTQFLVDQRTRSSSVTVVKGRVMVSTSKDRRTLSVGDQAEVSYEGSGELALSRVTPRLHGLWVPRLAEQQKQIDRAATLKASAKPTQPAPAKPAPTKPTPPTAPGLDQPMAPPTHEQDKK